MIRFRTAGLIAASFAALTVSTTAQASEIVVNDIGASRPDADSWGKLDAFNTGTAAITTTAARSGNGSLELMGDMTRVQLGYQLTSSRTRLGNVHAVTGLTFDWMVASDSSNLDYSPTLRLLVHDGKQLSVYGWNAKYNGVEGNPLDTWYSSVMTDLFWQWTYTGGDTLSAGKLVLQPLSSWISTLSAKAYVTAISVGAGEKAGAGYHAFADNVTIHRGSNVTTFNFESAVPEPATWAMLLIGFAGVGGMLRRRRVQPRVRYKLR